jgi:hypothetical protein
MNIQYREKYLKYKVKYLELKQNLDNQDAFGKKNNENNENNVKDYISNGGDINKLKNLNKLPKDFKIRLQEMISEKDAEIEHHTKYPSSNNNYNTIEYKRNVSIPAVQNKQKQDNCNPNIWNTDKCKKHHNTLNRLDVEIKDLENKVIRLNQQKSRINEVLKLLK